MVVLSALPFIRSAELCAQSRPQGNAGRVWLELGAEANRQSYRCNRCDEGGSTRASAAGPAIVGAIGVTLPLNFGVAITGRRFQQFNFEHSQHSRFLFVVGQYAIPMLPMLTINAGVGQARHDGDRTDSQSYRGKATASLFGFALRVPAAKRVAFTVNASLLGDVGDRDGPRSKTATFGVGLSLAARCRTGC